MSNIDAPEAFSDPDTRKREAESSSDELSRPPTTIQMTTHDAAARDGESRKKTTPDPDVSEDWTGWVELENHPMIFSTLLREWGVPNVEVREVVELDSLFESPGSSIYGLILLSRWTPADETNDIAKPPPEVWFANQVQSYSCATIGIMNIIMNHLELDLGEHLNAVREKTLTMTPLDRGWAIDRDKAIRDVHNSFGTSVDKAQIDYKLQEDYLAAEKSKKAAARKTTKRGWSKKKKKKQIDKEEENGFHFIAYVPASGAVWKMDGMERLPRKLGDVQSNDNWLAVCLSDLHGMWEKAMVDSFEVSLLSLAERTDYSGVDAEIKQMAQARLNWGPLLTTLLKIHANKGDLKAIMEGLDS